MDPDLMGTPSFQPQAHMGKIPISVENPIMCDGVPAVFLSHRHLFPIYRMPPNRSVYGTALLGKTAVYHRFIFADKIVLFNLRS